MTFTRWSSFIQYNWKGKQHLVRCHERFIFPLVPNDLEIVEILDVQVTFDDKFTRNSCKIAWFFSRNSCKISWNFYLSPGLDDLGPQSRTSLANPVENNVIKIPKDCHACVNLKYVILFVTVEQHIPKIWLQICIFKPKVCDL